MLNFRLLFFKFPTSTPLNDCLKLRFKMKAFFLHNQISLNVNISGDSQKYWPKSQPQYAYKRYAYKKKRVLSIRTTSFKQPCFLLLILKYILVRVNPFIKQWHPSPCSCQSIFLFGSPDEVGRSIFFSPLVD